MGHIVQQHIGDTFELTPQPFLDQGWVMALRVMSMAEIRLEVLLEAARLRTLSPVARLRRASRA